MPVAGILAVVGLLAIALMLRVRGSDVALDVSLQVGLVFVALYTLVGACSPHAFNGLTVVARVSLPSDLVYFSFATLTAVGYGDIVPVDPVARSLSNIEAILGQLYPATLLARLVSLGERSAASPQI